VFLSWKHRARAQATAPIDPDVGRSARMLPARREAARPLHEFLSDL